MKRQSDTTPARKLTPFERGYRAFNERKGVTDNPFAKPAGDGEGRSPYWQWYEGWRKADREAEVVR